MKQITACLVATFLIVFTAKAQLSDSKWTGTMNIPSPAECIFEFKKDTVYLYLGADNSLLETMSYTIKNDTLTLVKLSGMSPCGTDTKGIYRIEVKDDKLFIKPLSDDCQERLNAFPADPFTRQKN